MANTILGRRVQRTGAAEWTVYNSSGDIVGVFTTKRAAHAQAYGLTSNAVAAAAGYGGGTAAANVQVITLTDFSGTDAFSLRVEGVTTTSFVRGTNAAATDIQTALRTATGDTGLTVTGDTDEGPFTVTYVETTVQPLIDVVSESGCTGAVSMSTLGGVSGS